MPSDLLRYWIGGVRAGATVQQGENNTINQTINKIDLTSLPEFIKAFSDKENASKELLDEANRKRDEIAAKLDITQEAVGGFFETLREQDVPPERLKAKLTEIASRFEETRQRLAALDPDDPATKALWDQAQIELDKGRPDAASALLQRAEEAELAAVAQARAIAQQATAAADARQLNAAKWREGRGDVALTQLHYGEAAGHFAEAASMAERDDAAVWHYLMRQASALYDRGSEFGDNAALHEAIAVYRDALSHVPRDRVPLDWAATQHDLGDALRTLGKWEVGTEHLEQAVAVYREALEERKRELVPLDWAATQNNIGITLLRLGEREAGTERLQQAMAVLREALEERKRELVPLAWARTQNNIGITLLKLDDREPGTARLEQAVTAFQNALEEHTRERMPLDWAKAQNNLGTALWRLAGKHSAIGDLISSIYGRKGITRRRELIQQAIIAYQESTEERTRQRVPLAWARTQHNIGLALLSLGDQEAGTEHLEQAVTALRNALEERTRERMPLAWARTQAALGKALLTLGERETGTEQLEQALKAYDGALAVLVEKHDEHYYGICRANRDKAIARLTERLDEGYTDCTFN
jgi:tetratricopeptide (TPR) repeat protein